MTAETKGTQASCQCGPRASSLQERLGRQDARGPHSLEGCDPFSGQPSVSLFLKDRMSQREMHIRADASKLAPECNSDSRVEHATRVLFPATRREHFTAHVQPRRISKSVRLQICMPLTDTRGSADAQDREPARGRSVRNSRAGIVFVKDTNFKCVTSLFMQKSFRNRIQQKLIRQLTGRP